MRQPTLKPLPVPSRAGWFTGTRAWLIGLGLVAVLLAALIARETVFAQPAAVAIRTATADVGTVQSVVSGTGSLQPAGRLNVSFKAAGTLTEVDVKVGDKVTTGQLLARIDASTLQASLAQAQASLASAQANLQSVQSPLTSAQLAQLQHQLTAAQQNYSNTVASVNATNQADAAAVANDQAACNATPPGAACNQLSSDKTKQNMDAISGQGRINSGSQQVTSARDNLTIQSQIKPSSLASAQAQVAQAQAQLQAAQLSVNQAALTSPTSGVVVSINGVPGESVAGGGTGSTAQAPGTLAPQPASGSSSAGSSAFMVIDDNSSLVAVMPFAETDAAKLATNQTAAITFDAIPNLAVTGHVLGISPTATVVSNVVDYYVTFVLNLTDPRLREGMTVNAAVTVAQADNAVRVPNAAVHTSGGTTSVTVLSGGQQTPTEVVTGVVGDTYTEIKAGLRAGDKVVLPSLRTGTTTTGSGTRGGGLGGLGGGGFRAAGGG